MLSVVFSVVFQYEVQVGHVSFKGLHIQIPVELPAHPEVVAYIFMHPAEVASKPLPRHFIEVPGFLKEVKFISIPHDAALPELVEKEEEFLEVGSIRHLTHQIGSPQQLSEQFCLRGWEGDLVNLCPKVGAGENAGKSVEILFWISILSYVACHKLDAPLGVDIDILCAGSATVITSLNKPRIVHQRAYKAEHYLLLRKEGSGYNGTMDEPGHSQKGISSMLQIMVLGGAFTITRVFTVEEAYYIGEGTVQGFEVEL